MSLVLFFVYKYKKKKSKACRQTTTTMYCKLKRCKTSAFIFFTTNQLPVLILSRYLVKNINTRHVCAFVWSIAFFYEKLLRKKKKGMSKYKHMSIVFIICLTIVGFGLKYMGHFPPPPSLPFLPEEEEEASPLLQNEEVLSSDDWEVV